MLIQDEFPNWPVINEQRAARASAKLAAEAAGEEFASKSPLERKRNINRSEVPKSWTDYRTTHDVSFKHQGRPGKSLLKRKRNINRSDFQFAIEMQKKSGFLSQAIEDNDKTSVKALLEKGAPIPDNVEDIKNETIKSIIKEEQEKRTRARELYNAIKQKDENKVKKLLEDGVQLPRTELEINKGINEKNTPLKTAEKIGNSKIIKLINSGIFYIHGRAIDHTPLMVLNFGSILSHIENKSMTANEFGALHNFYARYMI